MKNRLKRLAEALCMTPGTNLRLEQADHKDGNGKRWWLVGCVEGDQPLSRTRNVPTATQALQIVKDWLAPEIDGIAKKKREISLRREVSEHELDSFHDAVYDAIGESLDHEELLALFERLPTYLQVMAFENGMNDTVFRDEALNHLQQKGT
jgi:hypothetical protein